MATIKKRGSSYLIRTYSGYDSAGKQIEKTMTWRPDPKMTERQIQKEVQRQAILFEEKVKTGKATDGGIRFSVFIDTWFKDYAKEHLRQRTYYRYEELSKRIKESLGHMKLNKIRPQHLIDFYAFLAQDGQNKRTGKGLSPKTIKHYHGLVSSILERAVKWGMIETNPCKKIDAPKVPEHEVECMADDEALLFLDALEGESSEDKAMFVLLLFTGMRRGELLGLEWPDVDLDNGVVNIRRTSQYAPEVGTYTDTTKTKKSVRSIDISSAVVDALRAHRADQNERRLGAGDRWVNSGRVFTNVDGSTMWLNTPYKHLQAITEKHGLKKITLHSLRHTNATLMISQGVNVTAVSARLGHSQTSTTMNIYAHQLRSANKAAADALQSALTHKDQAKTKAGE